MSSLTSCKRLQSGTNSALMIYLIDISKDVLRIVNTPDIIALAARVLLLSIVLCTRVAIFF
jgi:hypothetical protein